MVQIPNQAAVKIALELKKLLVDNSLLDVYAVSFSQATFLFWDLFCILLFFGFQFCLDFYQWFHFAFLLCCSSQSDLEANMFKVMSCFCLYVVVVLVPQKRCT